LLIAWSPHVLGITDSSGNASAERGIEAQLPRETE
jgi:hypothetical protein